jgi:small subunit ribosomal protein S4
MGDPRRIKNKYKTPNHPWEKLRLEAEKPLMREYGLVNKKELWKVTSKLKSFKDTAKKLVAAKSEQANTEKKQMVGRMKSYGLITTDVLDEILGLEIQQLLDRRLQTIVFKKGLARTIKQARQMITHRHIAVDGIKITAPSYLVRISEQDSIMFMPSSSFADETHPERAQEEVSKTKEDKVKESKEAKPKKADEVVEEKAILEASEEIKEEAVSDVPDDMEVESADVKPKAEEIKEELKEELKKEAPDSKDESSKVDDVKEDVEAEIKE